jgi:primosomal protein N' (replication factor Y)
LILHCLNKGRSALILAPEVALALQVFERVSEAFPEMEVHLYHGYQNPAERARLFARCARNDQPKVVVGTRSAVFLPCRCWGLIVLDEEHDSSFKQDERLSYQAKEVAYFLSRQHKGLLLLGSATPDMRSYSSARQGTIGLSRLMRRVGPHSLPEVQFVNLLEDKALEGPLSPQAFEALQGCLNRDEQAIILLNRRGYAPLVYCTSCGQVVKCQRCEVGLTYHKQLERLVCHYCGFSHPFPLPCPECGSHQFVPLSHGTEQVEEFLKSRLGGERELLRLDRDSTRRQGSMEAILDRFSAGEARVLIGTQMCSKGHHFPNVTRVIVIDGDVGLNLPDYRATEKTFQLLVQVAGRSGRGDNPGKVIIQTRNPDHYCWHFVQHNDYEGFFQQEMVRRQRVGYPPFVKLGLLRMSFPQSWPKGMDKVQQVASALRNQAGDSGARLLGPAPSPIRKIRGRQRYQCLIKASNWADIRSICRPALELNTAGMPFRVSLDLDPGQML